VTTLKSNATDFQYVCITLPSTVHHHDSYLSVSSALATQEFAMTESKLDTQISIILPENLQRESHGSCGPPTPVTLLQLLRKQTNPGTSTAQTH